MLYVRTSCPCPCNMFMMHVLAACPCRMSKLHVNPASPFSISMMHVRASYPCQRCMSMLRVRVACPFSCCISSLCCMSLKWKSLCPCCIPMLHYKSNQINSQTFRIFMSLLPIHVACPCCLSVVHFRAACLRCILCCLTLLHANVYGSFKGNVA